jgi:hypothetical protein
MNISNIYRTNEMIHTILLLLPCNHPSDLNHHTVAKNIQTIQFTRSHHHFDTTQNQIRMNNNQIEITSILEEIKQFQQSSVKNCQTAEFTGSKQFDP